LRFVNDDDIREVANGNLPRVPATIDSAAGIRHSYLYMPPILAPAYFFLGYADGL
jgi:hypothetical protein